MPGRILLIEDDAPTQLLVSAFLAEDHYDVMIKDNAADALDAVAEHSFNIILCDLGLPDSRGPGIVKKIKEISPETEIIVLTGESDSLIVREATDFGARDYLVKPLQKNRLRTSMRNVVSYYQLKKQLSASTEQVTENKQFVGLVGVSAPMQGLFRTIEAVSPNLLPVLITGPKGTEKDVVAEAIHANSLRQDARIVFIDCADQQESQLAEMIFGKKGGVRKAEGGTLVLRDVECIGPNLQRRLFRFLQSGMGLREGEEDIGDVRFLATTSLNTKEFPDHPDLYQPLMKLLQMMMLSVPALSERRDDIPFLIHYYIEKANQAHQRQFKLIEPEFLAELQQKDWPGQTEELQDFISHIVSANDGEIILASMQALSQSVMPAVDAMSRDEFINFIQTTLFRHKRPELILSLRELEDMAVQHAIDCCDHHLPSAADALKVSLATLYRKKA